MEDKDIIRLLGGATVVAKKLGFGKFGPQRVQNWVLRNRIPLRLKVDHPRLFMFRMRKQAKKEQQITPLKSD